MYTYSSTEENRFRPSKMARSAAAKQAKKQPTLVLERLPHRRDGRNVRKPKRGGVSSHCCCGCASLAAAVAAIAAAVQSQSGARAEAAVLANRTATVRQALSRQPLSASLHSSLAKLLARQGHTDEAAEHFHRAASLPPASLTHIAAARPFAQAVFAQKQRPPWKSSLPVGPDGGWARTAEGVADTTEPEIGSGLCNVDVRGELTLAQFEEEYVRPGRPVLFSLDQIQPSATQPFDRWTRASVLDRYGERETTTISSSQVKVDRRLHESTCSLSASNACTRR